jgi:nucleotide-binding universal stress UspA family protein
MTPISSPVLIPPLLLATDGSPSARLAQKLVRSLVQVLQTRGDTIKQSAQEERSQGKNYPQEVSQEESSPASSEFGVAAILLMIVTVQPRVRSRPKLFGKKAVLLSLPGKQASGPATRLETSSEINSEKSPDANPVVTSEANHGSDRVAHHETSFKGQSDPKNGDKGTSWILDQESLVALVESDFPDREFPNRGIFSLQLRQGRPATEILNCARTMQAGLIAVGHRGTDGMRELLLGSVSTAIARYAPCSVLVARGRADATTEPNWGHVLVVVEQSSATTQAIAAVRQLAAAGIRQVTLLHIQHPLNVSYLFGPFVAPAPTWQHSQSLQRAQKEEGEELLQRVKASLALPDVTIQSRLQTGDPGPIICQIAQELQVNLVLIGSDPTRRSLLFPLQSPLQSLRHPRQGKRSTASQAVLRNTRLSITEDYVIHYAPCPVLLCKPPTARPSSPS